MHFALLTFLNALVFYVYFSAIKTMNYHWSELLEGAELASITNLVFRFGVFGVGIVFVISLIATVLSLKNRKKDNRSFWHSAFAWLALTEIFVIMVVGLGLVLPAFYVSYELSG